MIGTLLRIGMDQPPARSRRAGADVPAADHVLLDLRDGVRQPARSGDPAHPSRRRRRGPVGVLEGSSSTALEAEGALRVRTTRETRRARSAARSRRRPRRSSRTGDCPGRGRPAEGPRRSAASSGATTGTAAPKVQLLADVSDPIAPQIVQGLLQKVSFTAAPETMATEGIAMFEKYSGPLTPAQRAIGRSVGLGRCGRNGSGGHVPDRDAAPAFGVADRDRQRDAARQRRHGRRSRSTPPASA